MFVSGFLCSKKKTYKKRVDFFLQNVDFSEFFRISFFRSKKHFLLSRISKNAFFRLFLHTHKKNIREKGRFFDRKHTFCKMSIFFDFVRTSLLRSKKLYFLSRISKYVSFLPFLLKKKTYKKKVDFLTKTMG